MGNGEQICIWKDKWILRSSASLPLQPGCGLSEDDRVAALIDWTTSGWKSQLMRELFGETMAAVVCQLPLSSFANCDCPYWPHSATGEFMVRSAYHLHKQFIVASVGESFLQGY